VQIKVLLQKVQETDKVLQEGQTPRASAGTLADPFDNAMQI
jgi:hypothetical protein